MEYAAGLPGTYAADQQVFLRRVFGWMLLGLAVTGAVAYLIGQNTDLMRNITENPLLLILLFAVQLGLVVTVAAAINRLSPALALGLFLLYAAINGFLFALVFDLYSSESIFTTFLITGGMFGVMAAIGYTTKADLTKLGTILFMALIGLIIATFVNILVSNSALYWITTYAGVIIFSGLTAYDMQKLKQINEQTGERLDTSGERQAIVGALALYLDFINLFLFLLRIFGSSR